MDLQHASVLAQTGTATGGGSALGTLLPFALLAVAFWFLLIRPQRKRAQEAAQTRSSLQVGAEVMTTAGLYGTVAHVDDDAVLLEVAPGVTNRYAKGAVARVLRTPGDAVPADERLDDPVDDGAVDDGAVEERETVEREIDEREIDVRRADVREDRPGEDRGPDGPATTGR